MGKFNAEIFILVAVEHFQNWPGRFEPRVDESKGHRNAKSVQRPANFERADDWAQRAGRVAEIKNVGRLFQINLARNLA